MDASSADGGATDGGNRDSGAIDGGTDAGGEDAGPGYQPLVAFVADAESVGDVELYVKSVS